jgi:hypothetical protein
MSYIFGTVVVGDDDQRGREPAQPVDSIPDSNEPDIGNGIGSFVEGGPRYIGLTSWK